MEIKIDNLDIWNIEAQKYWQYPKTYDINKRREEAKAIVLSGNVLGSTKVDGAWNMIVRDMEGNYHLRSRTKNVDGGFVDKADWIPQIINEIDLPKGTAVIGEIYLPNNEGSRKVTSVLNCLKSKCLERQEKGEFLHYYIFDVIMWNGKSIVEVPFEKRIKDYLYQLKDRNYSYIEIAEYKEGQELWDLYGEVLSQNREGIVITQKSAKYYFKRTPARITIKLKKELENPIDAFLDGGYEPPTKEYTGKSPETWSYWLNVKTGEKTDKNKYVEYSNGRAWIPITKNYYFNRAGSISISLMKDGEPYHLGFISGITDDVREGIVANPEKWKGKVVVVNAMMLEKIEGNYSLRHGKIMEWREDKTAEECTFDQISSEEV